MLKNGMIELPEGVKITPQRDWLAIQRSIEKKKQEAEKMEMEINPRRRPWLHNDDVASSYRRQILAQNLEQQAKNSREKSNREGLFYNSSAWSDYHRAGLKNAILEAEKLRDHGEEITPEPIDGNVDNRPGTTGTDVRSILK